MASPSVTYTFSNSTTADASQVNQNFTDLINGLTDGTKDLSISALTCAGTATLNGNVALGNSGSDTLSITASLSSSIPIGTTYSYDIGSATLGLRKVYLGASDSAARSVAIAAGAVTSSYTFTLPVAVPAAANTVCEVDTSGTVTFTQRSNRALTSVANADSPVTATSASEGFLCNATAGAITINLPAAASNTKKVIFFKKTDSSTNAITLDGNGAETIDGATTTTLNTQYETVEIWCDGSNWHVVRRMAPSVWTAYTPTWGSTGVAPAIGSGLLTAFYKRDGDSVDVMLFIKAGGTTTFGTGEWTFTTPFTADTAKVPSTNGADIGQNIGTAQMEDDSAGARYVGAVSLKTSTLAWVWRADASTTNGVQSSDPFTWADNDQMTMRFKIPVSGWKG